jgi:anti-anti-sigma factor
MSLQTEKRDNYSVIKINSDKLDSLLAPTLKSELVLLNSEGIKNIVIDLSSTRYCDSSGLSAILIGNRLCKESEGVLVLSGLQEPVKKIIAISKLDTILQISNTLDEAAKMI